jgi:hypothetical protein
VITSNPAGLVSKEDTRKSASIGLNPARMFEEKNTSKAEL